MNARTVIGAAACATLAAGLILGFAETGSPAHNRQLALDERRLAQIHDVARQISSDAKPSQTAPPTMPEPRLWDHHDDLRAQVAYTKTGPRRYSLCSTFELSGDAYNEYYDDATWSHPAGRYCYAFSVDSSNPDHRVPATVVPSGTPSR